MFHMSQIDLFDSYGTLNNLVRNIFELDQSFIFFPNIRNIFGAIIVFSFTLYPYVYLVSRSAFLNQSRTVLESGRILGPIFFLILVQFLID